MTIEYVLILVAFAFFIMQALLGPNLAFKEMGPKLGARVEKQLITGNGFSAQPGTRHQWSR
jgi:hypothetical protein